MGKKYVLFYSISTFVCYIFDAFTFIIMYKNFSVAGDEHTEILMLVGSLTFITIDVFYIIWLANIKSVLPSKMASVVTDAIFGLKSKVKQELVASLRRDQRLSAD